MKKAYSVQGAENGCVVFAELGVTARRMGANELNCEFEDVESCRRAPAFDQYADAGKVPMQAFLDAGWWMSCGNCEAQVFGDHEGHLVHDDTVYCCEACRDTDLKYTVMRARRVQAWTDFAHESWPGSTVRHVYVFNDCPTIDFAFPGGQYPAKWDGHKSALTVMQCDVDAWHVFAGKPNNLAGATQS